jgi:hypothetical protein
MGQYAAKTEVSEEKSRGEIESILLRYGADAFSYGWEADRAVIIFRASDRRIRFEIKMPGKDDREIRQYEDRYGRWIKRADAAALKEWQQQRRQRWRALALVIKAKLEAVDSGIAEFEEEFMAHILMPDGRTVGQHVLPQVDEAYKSGLMPQKFLALTAGND